MTTFDDKEKAAENKYAHDREMDFKVHARAHKLIGLWAAGKMGLSGAQADEYVQSVIVMDMAKTNPQHLLEKIHQDLIEKEVRINEHDVRAEIYRLEQLARQQILES